MSLRTRIALTFLVLLTGVLGAALSTVSVANRHNAERDVEHQLEFGQQTFGAQLVTNSRLLTLATQTVAKDYAFREVLAGNDTETINSVLETAGERVKAAMVVLTDLDGRVIAAHGSRLMHFPIAKVQHLEKNGPAAAHVMVDDGNIYQVVVVPIESPLTVAWLAMGFKLDARAARELADATGLGVSLSVQTSQGVKQVASTEAAVDPSLGGSIFSRQIELSSLDDEKVYATLSRSLDEARAPFERLTNTLFLIAGVSLVGFAAAAFWIARNITRPLHDLTKSVDKIRGGDYGVDLTLPRRDELGVLSEGLQLMQTAVMSRDQSIRRLAYEDTLTGLMNRAAFSTNLNQALDAAAGASIGVALINLNRFRRINEHLGYSVGDAVLVKVASRLSAVPGMNAAVARLDADRFAAFSTMSEDGELPAWGTSLLLALSEPILVEAQPIDVSASIGLAASGLNTLRADDLLRNADLAVEHARREKRPLAVYQESLRPASRDQLSLLGELRQAVERDELRLFFQPKIELSTGRIAGAEVLIRWQHPTRGLQSPAAFIPFAEQTGFIRRITRWMLDRAIAQAALWHHTGSSLTLAVNISADDVGDPRFDTRVAGLITRHQLPPSLLTLELTESGFIDDPASALRMLEAVAAMGVQISIDDFGTGYSSLSQLARMPANELKIDRSFVLGLESDAEYAAVVRSAIDMGHSLGMKVVAEGIENDVSAQRLKALGCDIAQGYFYAKPMPADAFEKWMSGKTRVPVIATPLDFTVDQLNDTMNLAAY